MTGSETGRSTSPAAPTTGVAAGVPFIALPPGGATTSTTPVVLAWHLMDPPRSEKAFAAALPLSGVDAWRIYFGLPMHGSRLPAGGLEELMRLAYEDVVLNLDGPIASQATAEFAPAFEELRQRFDLGSGPLAVVGGSLGSAIALLVLTESGVDFDAALLLSPMVQLKRKVEGLSEMFGVTYNWSNRALEVANRMDFVARADEVARRQPAVLLIVGEQDIAAFRESAADLRDTLKQLYTDARRVDLALIPGMGHALAEEPGMEPAPQSPHASEVDRLAVEWLGRHLKPS